MLKESTERYRQAAAALDDARKAVIEAAVEALRAGERPTDVAAASPFTPSYIRRLAKEQGVEAAAPGPKPARRDER